MDSLRNRELQLEQLMPVIREKLGRGRNVKFSPNGTSMLPLIRQGEDTVVLSPLPGRLKKYDVPLYQRDNGQYVLHRIVKVGDTYTCMGDNQFKKEQGIRPDQMIAVVTSLNRKGKHIEVDQFGYKLYCRLWHYSRPLRYLLWKCRKRLGRQEQ